MYDCSDHRFCMQCHKSMKRVQRIEMGWSVMTGKSYRSTRNCVCCGKTARFWSGWVKMAGEIIIAGWCSKRCNKLREGYQGPWHRRDGILRGEVA